MATKLSIPTRFLIVRKDAGTVALRGRGGRFRGRKGPDSRTPYYGVGDTTRARHLDRTRDWNNDGRITPNERGGVILGRSVRVKASGRAKGYERRV
jgi:hypothetical protein